MIKIFIEVIVGKLAPAYFELSVEKLPEIGQTIPLSIDNIVSNNREGILGAWGNIATITAKTKTTISLGNESRKGPCYEATLSKS
jgi:hypothetical protein